MLNAPKGDNLLNMAIKENIIKNYPCGLRVVVRPMPNFKSVSTAVYIGVGSGAEAENEHGLAHAVEHMLFKGTATRTAEQIAQTLANLGVQYNAYTSNTATCYHTKGLLTNLDDCCDILSDMYFNTKFADDEFKREMEVIVQEISMRDDLPHGALAELSMETFYAGTKFEHPIAGTIKGVRGFKAEQIYDFIKRNYTAPNTIIAFSGDITVDQVERVVKKYFLNRFKDKSKPNAPVKTDECVNPPAKHTGRKKKVNQHHAAILFPTVNQWHEDKYALEFIDGILTTDMSSRLFLSVRERLGLVYSIHGGTQMTDIGGYYYIRFSCTPQNTAKVLEVIESEINKFKTEGATDEEVQKVKNVEKASRFFDDEYVELTNQRIVTQLGELGFIIDTAEFLQKMNAVTPKIVQATAQKYLDMPRATVCIIGHKWNKLFK